MSIKGTTRFVCANVTSSSLCEDVPFWERGNKYNTIPLVFMSKTPDYFILPIQPYLAKQDTTVYFLKKKFTDTTRQVLFISKICPGGHHKISLSIFSLYLGSSFIRKNGQSVWRLKFGLHFDVVTKIQRNKIWCSNHNCTGLNTSSILGVFIIIGKVRHLYLLHVVRSFVIL